MSSQQGGRCPLSEAERQSPAGRAGRTSQSAPCQPIAPPPGSSTSRPARPSAARLRVLLVGEYYNEPPPARKIAFHCRNCRSRLKLFSSRSVVQESLHDRTKVSSRRRRAGRRRRRRRSCLARPPRVLAAAADGRKTAQMAHEAQMAQMALTALSGRSGRRRFCRSTDGLGRGRGGRVRRYVVGRAEAAVEPRGDSDGGRFGRR